MKSLFPITVNRIQLNGKNKNALKKKKNSKSNLEIVKKEVIFPMNYYKTEESSDNSLIKVSLRKSKMKYHRKTLSQIILNNSISSLQRYTMSSMTTNQTNNDLSNSISFNDNYYSRNRNVSFNQKSFEVKIPGKKSESCDKTDLRTLTLDRRVNKANSFSKKLNGNVDFGLIPLKLSDHTQFADKNKYKDGNSISKIIKLQSYYRRYICRKYIYDNLARYYKMEAFLLHINHIFHQTKKKYRKVIFLKIKTHIASRYYLTQKEYNFLAFLNEKNIYTFEDFKKYLGKLVKLIEQ